MSFSFFTQRREDAKMSVRIGAIKEGGNRR